MQVEKKEKPQDEQAEPDAAGDDANSERVLSRREEKAPARDREQPTTGEDLPSNSGAGGVSDAPPDLGEPVHAPGSVVGADSTSPGPAPEPETPGSESTPGKSGGLFSRFSEGGKK